MPEPSAPDAAAADVAPRPSVSSSSAVDPSCSVAAILPSDAPAETPEPLPRYNIMYYRVDNIRQVKGQGGRQVGSFGGNPTWTEDDLRALAAECVRLLQAGELQEEAVKEWGKQKVWG